jgi:hypothetical protein
MSEQKSQPKKMKTNNRSRLRALLWPILLAAIGIALLLGVMGILPGLDFWTLLRYWPVLLVAIGVDFLLQHSRWHVLNLITDVFGTFTIIIGVVILFAPAMLYLQSDRQAHYDRFAVPINDVEQAQITLQFAGQPVEATALEDSTLLLDAQLDYYGQVDFQTRGSLNKVVSLKPHSGATTKWSPLSGGQDDIGEMHWQIGLSPSIPLDLAIEGGDGAVTLDLTNLQLNSLAVVGGGGAMALDLPAGMQSYEAAVNAGRGDLIAKLVSGPGLALDLIGGSGQATLILPVDMHLQVEVKDSGPGVVTLPPNLDLRERGIGSGQGLWQSPAYSDDQAVINIIISKIGSGEIRVEYR